jgi:hypothetical protein
LPKHSLFTTRRHKSRNQKYAKSVGRPSLATKRYLSQLRHPGIVSHSNAGTMSGIPEHSNYDTLTASRKRADSHEPNATPPHAQRIIDATQTEHSHAAKPHAYPSPWHDYDERPRRFSSADFGYVGSRLSPQLSSTNPHGEVRRLSGNFNSPTEVELERTKEHRRSLKGVEKLRSKVKDWVRA